MYSWDICWLADWLNQWTSSAVHGTCRPLLCCPRRSNSKLSLNLDPMYAFTELWARSVWATEKGYTGPMNCGTSSLIQSVSHSTNISWIHWILGIIYSSGAATLRKMHKAFFPPTVHSSEWRVTKMCSKLKSNYFLPFRRLSFHLAYIFLCCAEAFDFN